MELPGRVPMPVNDPEIDAGTMIGAGVVDTPGGRVPVGAGLGVGIWLQSGTRQQASLGSARRTQLDGVLV